jgi:hypothetical protein
MENINPDNLAAVKKNQNKITEFREMFLAWKKHPVVVIAGYIIGFPNDTRESILHDIEVLKRELPIDLLYFTNLTPLPGSEDHQRAVRAGLWIDPDLNKYDLNHRVTHHPRMSDAEWDRVYAEVWDRFYSWEHMETIVRRLVALGSNKRRTTINRLLFFHDFHRVYGVHPLEGGFFRIKTRRDRRPGLPREHPIPFYLRFAATEVHNFFALTRSALRFRRILRRVMKDPENRSYRDTAITPPGLDELSLGLYSETRGGGAEIEKVRRQRAIIDKARARKEAESTELLDAAE